MITTNMYLYSPLTRVVSTDGCICSLVLARFNESNLGNTRVETQIALCGILFTQVNFKPHAGRDILTNI